VQSVGEQPASATPDIPEPMEIAAFGVTLLSTKPLLVPLLVYNVLSMLFSTFTGTRH